MGLCAGGLSTRSVLTWHKVVSFFFLSMLLYIVCAKKRYIPLRL